MPNIRFVYVVSHLNEMDEPTPIFVTFDEGVAQEISDRLGGRIDRVVLLGTEFDE